ncbi:hypothetical protein MKEN_01315700 [Mycena kentingensis (nom. inval.)]|nr:hypothetical protein MKEN_01315700 [Mycena kentingensis (nom. inval.)]
MAKCKFLGGCTSSRIKENGLCVSHICAIPSCKGEVHRTGAFKYCAEHKCNAPGCGEQRLLLNHPECMFCNYHECRAAGCYKMSGTSRFCSTKCQSWFQYAKDSETGQRLEAKQRRGADW